MSHDQPDDIKEIEGRLQAFKQKSQIGNGVDRPPSARAYRSGAWVQAMRYGLEFMTALAVGFGIGVALDHWLDTGPWFMVGMGVLGFIAGVLNVYRASEDHYKPDP